MLNTLKCFWANEDGYLVAHDWAILASVLLLGSVLVLFSPEPEPLPPPQPVRIAPVEEPPVTAPVAP